MLGHLSWQKLFIEWCIVCVVALLVAIFTGHVLICLLVATICLLLWHAYHQLKLSHWLWSENQLFPPEAKGSWAPIFYGLYKLRLNQRTQRKRLASLLSYFRKGAESIPDAVVICDSDGHVSWCNQMAQSLLGLKWPQDQDQLITNLIRMPEFAVYVKNKAYDEPLVLRLSSKRFVEFRLLYPYIEDNLLIIGRDVTDKYQADKMRRNFFANVSHELRIPLTVLQGYVELLSESNQEPTELETKAYESMSNQVKRLDSLVAQLITLSKIETTSASDFSQKINMSGLIRSVIEDYQSASGIKYTIKATIEPDIQIVGDEGQLRSVVSNLLYNAIEHNEAGTEIEISWAIQPDRSGKPKEAIFCIRDKGKGIASEHINRLTERFYRVDSARSRDTGGGAGIGLAIVKHALNNHHSALEVSSIVGQGSCFQFALGIE